jgi:iron-sulfur cluster repair protein YtfE (RIC family)
MQNAALAQVWQQLRDSATHAIQVAKDDKDRSARIVENAMANTELMKDPEDAHTTAKALYWLIRNINKNVFMHKQENVELY